MNVLKHIDHIIFNSTFLQGDGNKEIKYVYVTLISPNLQLTFA